MNEFSSLVCKINNFSKQRNNRFFFAVKNHKSMTNTILKKKKKKIEKYYTSAQSYGTFFSVFRKGFLNSSIINSDS